MLKQLRTIMIVMSLMIVSSGYTTTTANAEPTINQEAKPEQILTCADISPHMRELMGTHECDGVPYVPGNRSFDDHVKEATPDQILTCKDASEHIREIINCDVNATGGNYSNDFNITIEEPPQPKLTVTKVNRTVPGKGIGESIGDLFKHIRSWVSGYFHKNEVRSPGAGPARS
ncbi:MAG: hypothetical protein O8C61_03930 [Candidatus Methanoperedens sp.]|nr:hypothetical protein [Candidatus Methanoperedens sp.]